MMQRVPNRYLPHAVAGVLLLGLVFLPAQRASAQSFVYNVPVLDQKAVQSLTDEKLLETYVEAMIDLEASTTFSRTAGFNMRDYNKYKDMIRYRVRLLGEINARKLDVPDTGIPCRM